MRWYPAPSPARTDEPSGEAGAHGMHANGGECGGQVSPHGLSRPIPASQFHHLRCCPTRAPISLIVEFLPVLTASGNRRLPRPMISWLVRGGTVERRKPPIELGKREQLIMKRLGRVRALFGFSERSAT